MGIVIVPLSFRFRLKCQCSISSASSAFLGLQMRYSILVESPLFSWQSLDLSADSRCTGNDLISMAASELNIANQIIISIHYQTTNHKLDASEILESQLPSGTKEGEPVYMRLTTSADAEGFWTIDPPDNFAPMFVRTPTNSPRGLDQNMTKSDSIVPTQKINDPNVKIALFSYQDVSLKSLTPWKATRSGTRPGRNLVNTFRIPFFVKMWLSPKVELSI